MDGDCTGSPGGLPPKCHSLKFVSPTMELHVILGEDLSLPDIPSRQKPLEITLPLALGSATPIII